MRRALTEAALVIRVVSATCQPKRYARKRGAAKEKTSEERTGLDTPGSVPAFDLSGLRTGTGRLAAPPSTTSLDTIRSEINAMRREAQARADEQKLRQQRIAAAEQEAVAAAAHAIQEKTRLSASSSKRRTSATNDEETLSALLLSSYKHLNKPSDTFYRGKDVSQGLTAANDALRRAFFDDVDEVVRPKNKAATQRYMELVFPHLAEPHARAKHLDTLLDVVQQEHARQLERLQDEEDKDVGDFIAAEDPQLSRIAWLNTLEALDEATVRQLWRCGLLDVEALEDLATEIGEDDDVEWGDGAEAQQERVATPPLLQERIEALQRIHAAHEIAATIRFTELSSNPSIDLAPVLQKAKNHQYGEITEKELKLLEKYEELPRPITGTGVASDNRQGSKPPSTMVTESLLERALNPSNRLLYAVAERDKDLRESLEGLERIKRLSLLDPVFQEAVHFAHALEEESVDGYVRGRPTADKLGNLFGNKPQGNRTVAAIRARNGNAARGPMARSKHAADVPYFYNSARSVVPPRGSFNLPAPALTKEEKAALRGRRKRRRGPTRFAR